MKTTPKIPLAETDENQNKTIIVCEPPKEFQNLEGYWVHRDCIISFVALERTDRVKIEQLAGKMRLLFPDQDLDTRLFKKATNEQWATLLGLALAGYARCICVSDQ